MLNTCNSFNQKQNNNLSKKHVFLEIELFIQIHVSFHHYKKKIKCVVYLFQIQSDRLNFLEETVSSHPDLHPVFLSAF